MPFSMMSVSSWPARPTNASPCSSSSAPGASPTNISSASRVALAEDDRLAARPRAGSAGSRRGRRAPRRAPPRGSRSERRRPVDAPALHGLLDRRREPQLPWEATATPIESSDCQEAPVREQVGGELVALAHARAPGRGAPRPRRADAPRRGSARPARACARAARPGAGRRAAAGRLRSSRPRSPRRRAVTSFATIRSRFLASSLRARVREQVVGLGREADDDPLALRARRAPFRMSGVRTSSSAIGPSVLLELRAARPRRAIVADGRRARSPRVAAPACARAPPRCISSAERTAHELDAAGRREARSAPRPGPRARRDRAPPRRGDSPCRPTSGSRRSAPGRCPRPWARPSPARVSPARSRAARAAAASAAATIFSTSASRPLPSQPQAR